MKCPICSEEVRDTDQAERWGPEFAHATCVTAYNAGKLDERERCASAVREVSEGYRATAWGKAAECIGDACIAAIRGA